jgi:dihydrolipoamide dehydrogenase
MKREKYDIIVIGAGPGGHAAAQQAAGYGAKVAVIERNGWGGTCTHRGCIPTKALLACSRQFANLKKLKRLGITTGEATFDLALMKRHQQQMVAVSALGVQKTLRDAGVDLKSGTGKMTSSGMVEWITPEGDIHLLTAEKIVIAWGSEPLIPPGLRPSGRILTSDGFLTLNLLPDSIIIIGGSVIGVEFATFLAELNVRVTLVEILDRLLPHEDEEATALLTQELTRLGIAINTSGRIETLKETENGVCLTGTHGEKRLDLKADYALICTGRKPLLHRDELDRCGIQYEPGGVTVNDRQMTNVEGVYAVGDVTGGVMLAHRAGHQGKCVASHLFGDRSIICREDAVPSVVYTHPSIARVGLTEKQALEQGLNIEIRRIEYAANITARTELKGNGFVKAVFYKDRLAGVTIVGDDAGELIAPMGLAVTSSLGKKELRQWILPHPSLSEIFHFLT